MKHCLRICPPFVVAWRDLLAALVLLATAACSAPETIPRAADYSADYNKLTAAQFVEAHNRVRADVGVAPLQWSNQLARYAQQWADRLAADGVFEHRASDSLYGENLLVASVGQYNPTTVIQRLAADEQSNYNPRSGGCQPRLECRHYTQIVWAKTQRVGCGMAVGRAPAVDWPPAAQYWVCNYDPPGNLAAEHAY